MAEFIYSRISTNKQDTENQLVRLKEMYPEAAVFEEVASGAKSRPVLQTLLGGLKAGDILIVAALDRLGRRAGELLMLVDDLVKRGVTLKSVREGFDATTACGKLLIGILASVSEMERAVIAERTRVALAAKRAQGIVGGRRPTFSPAVVEQARVMKAAGQSCRAIGAALGMSPSRVSELTRTPVAA